MFSKDKCRDLFRDIDAREQSIKPSKEMIKSYVQAKVKMNLKEINLKRINVMILTGAFKGRNYIHAALRRI